MFNVGDLVKIKPNFLDEGEKNTDFFYRITSVNDQRKRCYISAINCDLPIVPEELVGFNMIEPINIH